MHAMMHMFSQIGDQERVIELYNSIRDNGQPLNILIFNTLIYAFARRAEIDKMIYCYDEMLSMGITPNEHVLRTLMEGFGR